MHKHFEKLVYRYKKNLGSVNYMFSVKLRADFGYHIRFGTMRNKKRKPNNNIGKRRKSR